MLTVVAVASLRSHEDSAIQLCALIALALGVVLLVIISTASFYFVLLTPFLSILAASWLTDAMARNRQRVGRNSPSVYNAAGHIAQFALASVGTRFKNRV
jgi:hypothetical protein